MSRKPKTVFKDFFASGTDGRYEKERVKLVEVIDYDNLLCLVDTTGQRIIFGCFDELLAKQHHVYLIDNEYVYKTLGDMIQPEVEGPVTIEIDIQGLNDTETFYLNENWLCFPTNYKHYFLLSFSTKFIEADVLKYQSATSFAELIASKSLINYQRAE